MNTNKFLASLFSAAPAMMSYRFVATLSLILASLGAPFTAAFAGSGNFNPFLITRQGSGGDAFTGATTGTSFGTINNGTTWLLEGGEISSWSDGGDTKTGANFFYRVYRSGSSAPSFTTVGLANVQASGNDIKWQKSDLGFNLAGVQILGATYNGTYNFDYYYQTSFNWGSQYRSAGSSTATTVPTSDFYTASYTLAGFDYYINQSSGSSSQSAASGGAAQLTGSVGVGKFGAGTVTLTNASNDYTGRTLVAEGTLQTTAAGVIPDGSDVVIKGGAVLDLNGNNETVAAVREYGTDDGGTITLGAGTLTVNGSNKGTLFQNSISGTGGLVLSGSGTTLALYGAQSYTGATTLSAGTLELRSANASTSYTLGGGSLRTISTGSIADTATIVITNSGSTFTVGANDTIGSFSGTAGTISIGSGITLTAGASANSTFSGVIEGSGALVKSGTGTLTFDGSSANTYSGTTTVNAGVLVLNKTGVNALAGTPTINSGGVIRLGASDQFNGSTTFLTINSGGNFDMNGFSETLALSGAGTVTLGSGTMTINPGLTDTFSGVIAGSGAIVKTNTGTQILSGNSTYTGATTVAEGVLVAANANALGTSAGATTVNTGTALQLSNASSMTVAENITLNGTGVSGSGGALRNVGGSNTVSGNLTLGSNARVAATGGSLSVSGNVGGGNNVLFVGAEENVAVSGVISGAGNTQDGTTTSLFKDGSKTLTLSGNNTYSGDTRISGGNLVVASGGNLGNGNSDVFIASGATLAVNSSATIAQIREWTNSNGGTATIGAGATLSVTGDGYNSYMNSIGGSGALSKSGSGTMNLYGTQSYTGTTTVSGGKISSGVAMSTTNVGVSGGTFETTAADILGNTAAVDISGGTYALGGNDTVGSFSISGGTLGGSSTLTAATYALNGGTVSANLGAGTATASSGTTALNGTLGATTVNVSGGTVNLGSANRLADTAAVTVSSGSLGIGAFNDTVGSLTLSGGTLGGSGTLTASTYALNGGNINAVLGAGAITVGGGTNALGSAGRLNSGSSLTVNSGQLTLGGNETVSSLAGSGGTIALLGNSLTVAGNTYSNLFEGVISGSGSLIKNGTGYLRLSGNNTYGGGTFLNGGTLDSDSTAAFGTGFIIVGSGTTLDLQSHNVSNSITNNGGTILSSGTVTDVFATNGTTDIGGSNSVIVDAGGNATVNVSGSSVTISNVEGAAQVNIGGTDATVGSVSGGTVNLSNAATGATVTTATAGTVNANAAGVNVGTISNTATVNVAGANGRVNTLAGGTVNANAAGLVITNKTGGNLAVSNGVTVALRGGNSAGVISGAGGIAKQGANTLTLSGNNTYTGATSVEQGRLVVANGGSLASTNTTVSGAGAALTVDGTISGVVTASSGGSVVGSGTVGTLNILGGGIFGPGNSPGITTATNGSSWANAGVYDWEIFSLTDAPGTSWDWLQVTGGTLDLNGITSAGGFTINLISLSGLNTQGALSGFSPTATYTNWLIASAPTIDGFTASDFNLNSSLFTGATGTFGIEQRAYGGGQGLFVTYNGSGGQPVPEPGTWAAAALLAGAAGYVRWRRRKQAEPQV